MARRDDAEVDGEGRMVRAEHDERWIDFHGVLSTRGRQVARAFVGIMREWVPEAGVPDLTQTKSVVWRRGDRIWARCWTDVRHQIALELPLIRDVPAEDLAAELGPGWRTFDVHASTADKLRFGSSVGLDPTGRMRLIVKKDDDLRGAAGQALDGMLRRSWLLSPDTVPYAGFRHGLAFPGRPKRPSAEDGLGAAGLSIGRPRTGADSGRGTGPG